MKTKEIPIEYIETDEKIVSIRNTQSEEAIGRYMEKYESGTSKPISVKEIDRQHYILIDGHHRIEAVKRNGKRKIDAEIIDVSDKDIYSRAVEENVEHGVSLTKDEEIKIIYNLIEDNKTDKEIGYVFKLSRQAITKRVNSTPSLKKLRSSKTKVPTIKGFLDGEKQVDVAKDLSISEGRVSQIIKEWLDEINELYETGTTKEEIINMQNEKNINLTSEKLNELIEEDLNKIIHGDCLKEIPKIEDNSVDCVIIDPPYGIDFQSNYKKEKFDKIKNDTNDSFKLLDNSLDKVKPKMKKNSHIYVFTSWKVYEKVKPIVEKHFEIKNCLIWNKEDRGMGDLNGNYAESYEMIIFATQGKRKLYSEKRPMNILNFSRTENSEHPTQKPVELIKELISNSTKESQVVLDYFSGSGSTIIAAKDIGRKWLGIELEEDYINVIKEKLK